MKSTIFLILLVLLFCSPYAGYSAENVALDKPVTVTTNGANDGNPGEGMKPSDVTDGSLEYIRITDQLEDGCVCYANNDYDELMELNITIDLQKKYRISRIRYNMGDVRRANTWNADVIITPFAKTGTTPGGSYAGAWTEHYGSGFLSKATIKLQKTRTAWDRDWLCIGEIEVYAEIPVLGDDYPHKDYDCPDCIGVCCGPDEWGFCIKNCTSFVAWRMNRDAGGDSFTNYMNGGHWGDAGHWDDNAVALGVLVNTIPKIGAIAHWGPYEGAGEIGHVAYVELVNEDGTVLISEYNFGNACAYGERTLQGSDIPRYIHYTYLDSDGDGVIDQWDGCPETPSNSYVNQSGCVRRLKGDFDDDCDVDGSDLAVFAAEFGRTDCQ